MTTSASCHQTHGQESDFLVSLQSAVRAHPEATTLRKWLGLASGNLSIAEFYRLVRAERQLSYLTIDVNAVCDLTCEGMCYYHPAIDKRKEHVSDDILKAAIDEAEQSLGLQTLVIAGKEPFLNTKKLFALLELAGPAQHRTYTAGTITNGRHLSRHREELRRLARSGCLDFLDISLDSGIASQHDRFRGRAGTFDLAFDALRDAAQHLDGVRVGISSVFRGDNEEGLLTLFREASRWTRHFFVTPMQPPPFSNLSPLPPKAVTGFFARLRSELQKLETEPELEVTVLLPGIYVYDAGAEHLFEWDDIQESPGGAIYVPSQAGKHTILYTLAALPEQAWRVARITSSGAYLGHLHFMQTATPESYACGFIQDQSIVALYDKSLDVGSPFHTILESRQQHQCRGRECWPTCFGGWSAAENSLLTGEPLVTQPKICLKGR